ncbi:MAG: relaxase/mobilization nuclease domain-containing protein [Paramuribaculum sp.]|nr:relaxase/mobilization nuclease domain-containing protein [Paramuribaculum sp.]
MIAKIKQGVGFAGLLHYANDILKKDTKLLDSDGVILVSNKTIASCFKAQAKAVQGDKKFVGHLILAFSPKDNDKLNDDKLKEISHEYMRKMGIVDTQFVIFQHHDQPHPHVHIVYNRVNNFGEFIKCDTNWRKSAAITKELTRDFGLTFGKGKEGVRRNRLKGKDRTKYKIFDIAKRVLETNFDWKNFIREMKKQGVEINFARNSKGEITGIVFTADRISYNGFKVDRSLSYDKLTAKLGVFESQNMNFKNEHPLNLDEETASLTEKSQENSPVLSRGKEQKTPFVSEDFTSIAKPDEVISDENSMVSDNISSPVGSAVNAAIELVLQPHVVPTTGGGGSSTPSKKDDDDDNYNKKKRSFRRR